MKLGNKSTLLLSSILRGENVEVYRLKQLPTFTALYDGVRIRIQCSGPELIRALKDIGAKVEARMKE